MPIFNMPITTDDTNLAKVLGQPLPVALYLYKGSDRTLDEAISKAAKQYAGQALIARVDLLSNPQTQRDYGNLAAPALVTLAKDNGSRKVKSQAGSIQATDVQAHIDYLLGKGPAPKTAAPASNGNTASSANGSQTTPQVVTDATFDGEVLKSQTPVLVDFWAPWCGPCRMIAPVVEQMAQKYAGRAKVVKVNVDDNPRIAQQFQIMSIPTLMVFKNGSAIKRQVGANPAIIPSMIEDALR
jgi:thioredoxin 1